MKIAKGVVAMATGSSTATPPPSSDYAMSATQFRAYQRELGDLTHAATGILLGLAEVTVKRYATSRPIPENVAIALRAVVLLHRMGKLQRLREMP